MRHYGIFACILLLAAALGHAFQQELFSVRTLTTELESPWEILWGPDDHIWVTERVARRVSRVDPVDGTKSVAAVIPEILQTHTQDGLLGMALHAGLLQGAGSDYVYVSYTYDADPGIGVSRRMKLRRYRYDPRSHTLASPADLITDLPAGTDHVGGRLVFGPDDKLYLTVGDEGSNWLDNYCNRNLAQELPSAAEVQKRNWTKYAGKVLRLNPDGSVPADNPVLAGVRSHIYSYGHRNAQGLVFGPGRLLYSSEHGPQTDDELNLIESGRNYGWPYIAGYKDDRQYTYSNWSASRSVPCKSLKFDAVAIPRSIPQFKENSWSDPRFTPPLETFFTVNNDQDVKDRKATIAPGSIDLYTAKDGIPGWGNSILIPSLKSGLVYRTKLALNGRSVEGEAVTLFKTDNRYRDIAIHKNGLAIYVSTDGGEPAANAQSLHYPGAILEFTYRGHATHAQR